MSTAQDKQAVVEMVVDSVTLKSAVGKDICVGDTGELSASNIASVTRFNGEDSTSTGTRQNLVDLVGATSPVGKYAGAANGSTFRMTNGTFYRKVGGVWIDPNKASKVIFTVMSDANATLTAAQLTSGLIRMTPTANRTLTLPSRSQLVELYPEMAITGNNFRFIMMNLNPGFTVALANGAALTYYGGTGAAATVQGDSTSEFIVYAVSSSEVYFSKLSHLAV